MSNYCDSPPAFYTEQRVKARKPHKCCETGRMIQPGEMYWRINGKWEGGLSSFAQSEAAYHFARWCNNVGDPHKEEECIPFTMIGEHVRECQDDDLSSEWERVCRGEITRTT